MRFLLSFVREDYSMEYLRYDIKNQMSQDYAKAFFYGHEYSENIDIKKRPTVIVCPGGGYDHTSDREGEIVALQFLAAGFNAAVLRYSCAPSRYPCAVIELGSFIKQLRADSDKLHIDKDNMIVLGFSAGGHLVANYCSMWSGELITGVLNCDKEDIRPNGQILCYPVITAGEFLHAGSFMSLLGEDAEEMRCKFSLENSVNKDVPRTFVWHSYEDETVDVRNSLLYVNALVDAGISTEYHMFAKGAHGVSLGTRLSSKPEGQNIEPYITPWIDLAVNWVK